MKIVMDADCLIKLTKSGLKEPVCNAFKVTIPGLVKKEIIDRGIEKNLPDAFVVEANVAKGILKVDKKRNPKHTAGEKEALSLFQSGSFDAIGSDDKRFIRQLNLFDIPYITPAVFIAIMLEQGDIKADEARRGLDNLSAYVSDSEYYAVKLFLARIFHKFT